MSTARSSTDQLAPHSKSPMAAQEKPETEDSQYQPLLKASQEYGNIPTGLRSGAGAAAGARRDGAAETRNNTKFLPSNSTDRLLSSVEGVSMDDETASETDEKPVIWETSFTEPPKSSVEPPKNNPEPPKTSVEPPKNNAEPPKSSAEPRQSIDKGPAVEKLISITPTSPKPPENVLSKAIEANVIDKTNHKNTLSIECKTAPIASPDPPRINAWAQDTKYNPKPKPLCLDAAQLEQNLNAFKVTSRSVDLKTLNITPPYINVVTSTKKSDTKTIQIDPKKAVIDDLASDAEPKEEKVKLKQSNSAASLLNGPMTDVPFADSDNASSSSSNQSNGKNSYEDADKAMKQGSKTEFGDSEISC